MTAIRIVEAVKKRALGADVLPTMLLTVTTTRPPATDLGHLLHKHPERLQSLSAGNRRVIVAESNTPAPAGGLALR